MATGGSDSSDSSWWNSFLNTAKEKSAAALEQISKDLQEFGTTIQKDTTQAVAKSASAIGQNLKREEGETEEEEEKSTADQLREGFYNFLSSVSQNLTAPEDVTAEEYVVQTRDPHVFDQTKARLHAIQVDPATYCNEPDEPLESYHKWLETFNVDDIKGDISELLVANSQVRSIYTKLVPAAVSHAEFWSRYYYKVHKLDQDEARRTALKERADMTSSQTFDEDLGWGDEDESWDTVPEVRKTTPTDSRLPKPTTDTDESEVTEKTSQKTEETPKDEEIPNRTESDKIVESEDKTDGNVENVNIEDVTVAQDSVRTLENVESDEKQIESEKAVLEKNVKELTLDPEQEVGGEVKEDRSPTESSHGSSGNKESSLGDEWEKDFDDIEITEEDIKNAQLASKNITLDDDDDLEEWESWD
ncbi:BSD domain-containing protein 1 [Holothuria leucospilota]|uniref:BSD domain-containing protein 1 n=1 Tax=Holothuria leucospilota TaxID=206669 RepID=A0A9Q1BUR6_HOLLE|nr:BSD domain-containing protein 1 [Holothuria leucospilota]